MTTDKARAEAEKRWYCSCCGSTYAEYCNGCPRCHYNEPGTSTSLWVVRIVPEAEYAALPARDAEAEGLREAVRVPKGFVRTDDGQLRKVLGTLPILADGAVLGPGGKAWLTSGAEVEPHMFVCQRPTPIEYDPSHELSDCYSTREAAKAALDAAGGAQ